jgi:hypothetical protein
MAEGLDLGKKVGPLPLGAWIVVVAGGLGIAWYTRRGTSSGDTTTVDDTSGQAGVGDGSVGGWSSTSAGTTSTSTTGVDAPTTNEEWAYRATQYLIGIGMNSASAQSATNKYIAEQQLSVSEYSMIQLALISIGPLPSPLSDAGATAPPSTTVKAAPTGVKATATFNDRVNIDWTPLSGVTGYRIFVNGKQNGVAVVFSAGTAFGLKSKTTYSITVCGVYGGTNGPMSTPITVKTK